MENTNKIEKAFFGKGVFKKAFTKEECTEINLFIEEFFNSVDDALRIDFKNEDPFWMSSTMNLLRGIVLHSLYINRKKEKLPTFWEILEDIKEIIDPEAFDAKITEMANYPHISPEEFLINDNPLKEIYGEYAYYEDIKQAIAQITHENTDTLKTIDDIRQCIIRNSADINWGINTVLPKEFQEFNAWYKQYPFRHLLTHPKIRTSFLYIFATPPSKENVCIRKRIINLFNMYIRFGKALRTLKKLEIENKEHTFNME